MHFKKFYQALLFALACTIAGLLLLWGGATLYLKVAQNYTAASPADCVARIVMRNGKYERGRIRRYGETLMEVPLTDELELKLVAATDRDGKESDVFFVSSQTPFGKCWLSPQLDYLSKFHGANAITAENPTMDDWYRCYVLRYPDCLVLAIVCTEALTDTLNGEPVYVVDADGILDATDPDYPDGLKFYFFVTPPVDELPDDYHIEGEHLTLRQYELAFFLRDK